MPSRPASDAGHCEKTALHFDLKLTEWGKYFASTIVVLKNAVPLNGIAFFTLLRSDDDGYINLSRRRAGMQVAVSAMLDRDGFSRPYIAGRVWKLA